MADSLYRASVKLRDSVSWCLPSAFIYRSVVACGLILAMLRCEVNSFYRRCRETRVCFTFILPSWPQYLTLILF